MIRVVNCKLNYNTKYFVNVNMENDSITYTLHVYGIKLSWIADCFKTVFYINYNRYYNYDSFIVKLDTYIMEMYVPKINIEYCVSQNLNR